MKEVKTIRITNPKAIAFIKKMVKDKEDFRNNLQGAAKKPCKCTGCNCKKKKDGQKKGNGNK